MTDAASTPPPESVVVPREPTALMRVRLRQIIGVGTPADMDDAWRRILDAAASSGLVIAAAPVSPSATDARSDGLRGALELWLGYDAMLRKITTLSGVLAGGQMKAADRRYDECLAATLAALSAPAAKADAHPDDDAVDRFAAAMKVKLAEARAKGRGGWSDPHECSQLFLSDELRRHAERSDPIDVANYAMFLHQRGETIAPAAKAADPMPVAPGWAPKKLVWEELEDELRGEISAAMDHTEDGTALEDDPLHEQSVEAVLRAVMSRLEARRVRECVDAPAREEPERCIACDEPFKAGDRHLPDADGGSIHTACCGPERESYTKGNGEPLGPDDPIPEGRIWQGPLARGGEVEQRFLAQIVDTAETIAFHAGVGSLETAGQIVSFLARHPDRLAEFMAGTLSPIDSGLFDHHDGRLSWHGKDGKVHSPDPTKVRALRTGAPS